MPDTAQRILRTLLPALLVWAVFALLSQTAPGRRLELLGFDFLTVSTAPSARIGTPIVIVGIDEPSFAEFDRQWPWPRRMHAELVDRLKAAGAIIIAFDVLFAESTSAEDDGRFAEAIQRAGNVVLASDMVVQESGQFQMAMQVEPVPLLREAGAITGLASISLDPDLVVRAMPQAAEAFWRRIVQAHAGAAGGAESRAELAAGSLVRYLGPDHSFRYVSYYQALDPERFLPPGTFDGKIVLIGHDIKVALGPGTSRGDAYATPYSALTGLLTPGVEIQATLVANALAGNTLREAARHWSLGMLGLALLLVTFAVREWQALRGALIVLAVMGGTAGLAIWLFAARGIWLPIVLSLLAVGIMYVVQVGSAFLRERRQRRQIEKAFRYYVSPEIVSEMTAHPERLVLGGARRDITIMFTDLAGFTSVSETISPEQVAALLNDYLTHMTRIVLDHGGTVDKFIGDAIMAFWGAPLPDPDQAWHACQAARKMQARLSELRQVYRAAGLPELRMRVGVHSGAAIVGNMGSTDRFDYTAIGDNINLASRLEGINKLYGTEILISGETARLLGGRMPLRRVDRVIVKGRTQPIDVHAFCDDSEIVRLGEVALVHYAARRWDEAAAAWRQLAALDPQDAISALFLKRIEEYRAAPPPDGWDGSIALEKL